MINTLAALLMATLAPPLTPPPATAPSVTVTAPLPEAEPTPEEMAKTVAQMQDMYDQSCASREYGAYDDVCEALNKQLKDAKVQAERLARTAARKAKASPPSSH